MTLHLFIALFIKRSFDKNKCSFYGCEMTLHLPWVEYDNFYAYSMQYKQTSHSVSDSITKFLTHSKFLFSTNVTFIFLNLLPELKFYDIF